LISVSLIRLHRTAEPVSGPESRQGDGHHCQPAKVNQPGQGLGDNRPKKLLDLEQFRRHVLFLLVGFLNKVLEQVKAS
jgi:hypothetical protein